MDELVQFLRDRLDEEAARAQRAIDGPRNAFVSADEDVEPLLFDDEGTFVLPARVLAEVASKRRILDFYEAAHSDALRDAVGIDSQDGTISAATAAVQCLATVYADHPDYNEAWRP